MCVCALVCVCVSVCVVSPSRKTVSELLREEGRSRKAHMCTVYSLSVAIPSIV